MLGILYMWQENNQDIEEVSFHTFCVPKLGDSTVSKTPAILKSSSGNSKWNDF